MVFDTQYKISDANLQKHLQDGTLITKLENGNFLLRRNGNNYSLHDSVSNNLIGWLEVVNKKHAKTNYLEIKKMFILSKFRKTDAILILLRSVKEALHTPFVITFNEPVTPAASKLILRIARNKFMKIKTLNGDGEIEKFDPKHLDDLDKAIILECDDVGFIWEAASNLPGQKYDPVYFKLFDDIS